MDLLSTTAVEPVRSLLPCAINRKCVVATRIEKKIQLQIVMQIKFRVNVGNDCKQHLIIQIGFHYTQEVFFTGHMVIQNWPRV